MGRRHGDQALDSGEGHSAALSRSHQTPADPVLAVVLVNREHAIRPKTLHGQSHAVWKWKRSNVQSGLSRKLYCSLSITLLTQNIVNSYYRDNFCFNLTVILGMFDKPLSNNIIYV